MGDFFVFNIDVPLWYKVDYLTVYNFSLLLQTITVLLLLKYIIYHTHVYLCLKDFPVKELINPN